MNDHRFKVGFISRSGLKVMPKEFTEEDANALVAELNEEHPAIEHFVVSPDGEVKPEVVPFTPPTPSFVPLMDESPFPPFGMHAGKPLRYVDAAYLDWCEGQSDMMRMHPDLADYIKRNRKAIDQDLKQSGALE